jgi:hypothetical protein
MEVFGFVLDGLYARSHFGVRDVFAWRDSVIGMAFVWFSIALDILPLPILAYCFYICSILGSSYWLSVAGGGTLACTIVFMIACLVAWVMQLLGHMDMVGHHRTVFRIMRVVFFLAAFVILSVLIFRFTIAETERNRRDFESYTQKNAGNDLEADEFAALSQFAIRKWIWDRSVAPKIPLVAFWMIWVAVFAIHMLAFNLIDGNRSELPQPRPKESMLDDVE